MTNQEAKRTLEKLEAAYRDLDPLALEDNSIQFVNKRIEALGMAISALEKQIPKKPKVPFDTWVCPECGRDVEYQAKLGDNILFHGQYDYCPKCGQAIDWEGEE